MRSIATGTVAAIAAPTLLRGDRLAALVAPPANAPAVMVRRAPGEDSLGQARRATGVALRGIELLARLPGGRWRDTCLTRAVAECVVLRRFGYPATLRIGVASGSAPAGPTSGIVAHAWAECPGVHCRTAGPDDATYARLTGHMTAPLDRRDDQP